MAWDQIAYRDGIPIYEKEYGVKYPDGTMVWMTEGDLGPIQIETPEEREEFRKDYEKRVSTLHLPITGALRFYTRTQTRSFSLPERIEE